MNRREFLAVGAIPPVVAALGARPVSAQSREAAVQDDRARWVSVMRRLADPVLTHLAAGTLRSAMPVEQAAGADRAGVTHLEALGRLLAGLAPWIELEADADGGRRTAHRVCRARAPRAWRGLSIRRRRTS